MSSSKSWGREGYIGTIHPTRRKRGCKNISTPPHPPKKNKNGCYHLNNGRIETSRYKTIFILCVHGNITCVYEHDENAVLPCSLLYCGSSHRSLITTLYHIFRKIIHVFSRAYFRPLYCVPFWTLALVCCISKYRPLAYWWGRGGGGGGLGGACPPPQMKFNHDLWPTKYWKK